MSKSYIVMIGPSLQSWGGISAVANVYRRAGLFERWSVTYVSTFEGGTPLQTGIAAFVGFYKYFVLLATGRVAVLHVHSASRWSFIRKSLFMLPTFACGKPVIFHLHGAEFSNVYENELGPFAKAYVRFILNRCAKIIVLSKRWQSMLEKITPNTGIRVIMNPIDGTTTPSPMQPNAGALLFLGELGERKGIFGLLDAVAGLDSALGWSLAIGGNGDLAGVEKRIKQLDIGDRVKLLGWVDGAKKTELLDTAMALILPSFAEGLPMSMLEAMAYGKPVITTPVGGIPDLLEDGVDGILVTPGDRTQLTNAIELLLRNPEIARQMGAQGRKKFETRFSSDVIIPQVEVLYSDLGMRPKAGCQVSN